MKMAKIYAVLVLIIKNKENIDYKARFKELEALCDKYRRMNGKFEYDCAIAVSGGKDSHFQVHIMKEKLGMNPILLALKIILR